MTDLLWSSIAGLRESGTRKLIPFRINVVGRPVQRSGGGNVYDVASVLRPGRSRAQLSLSDSDRCAYASPEHAACPAEQILDTCAALATKAIAQPTSSLVQARCLGIATRGFLRTTCKQPVDLSRAWVL